MSGLAADDAPSWVDSIIESLPTDQPPPVRDAADVITLSLSRSTAKHLSASWQWFERNKALQVADLELSRAEATELLNALRKALG